MRTGEQKQGSQDGFSANIFSVFFFVFFSSNPPTPFRGGWCWNDRLSNFFSPSRFNLSLIFLQDLKSKLAQVWHAATSILPPPRPDSKVITLTVTPRLGCMWGALCGRVCVHAYRHACTHVCVYGRPCILSRPTPATDKGGLIAPAAGWHCHSAEPQLHSIQSALVFKLSCPGDKTSGCHDNAECIPPLGLIRSHGMRASCPVCASEFVSLYTAVLKSNMIQIMTIVVNVWDIPHPRPNSAWSVSFWFIPLFFFIRPVLTGTRVREKQRSCRCEHQARTPTRLHH